MFVGTGYGRSFVAPSPPCLSFAYPHVLHLFFLIATPPRHLAQALGGFAICVYKARTQATRCFPCPSTQIAKTLMAQKTTACLGACREVPPETGQPVPPPTGHGRHYSGDFTRQNVENFFCLQFRANSEVVTVVLRFFFAKIVA